ncbi:molybdate ABC transporter substrate-binding protein, partial [Solirubrobacter soli]|uniref:molybdate ABC transporter substrate-binding protein n=1 Tax=Solirubrobacter soli TaxID=363832 RepID=UPI00042042FB
MRVFAAGSLRPAFEGLEAEFVFDNARELAARIEAGEPADVFCSASPAHPRRLHELGLVREPVAFASNRLVIAVRHEVGVFDLDTARFAIEVEGVPLGDYTRELFKTVPVLPEQIAFQETVVDAVAERVLNGDADAGILYATDVDFRPRLRAIEVQPAVRAVYVAAVASEHPEAQPFVDSLLGHPALRRAGFDLPS